jgi:hypothetical protein
MPMDGRAARGAEESSALADRGLLSGDLAPDQRIPQCAPAAIPADRILLKPVSLEEVETRLLQVVQQAPAAD